MTSASPTLYGRLHALERAAEAVEALLGSYTTASAQDGIDDAGKAYLAAITSNLSSIAGKLRTSARQTLADMGDAT